jgi:Ribbon-helix-helix protein, copG family
VDPPDPSERVNVYLPKSLISRVDRRAAELGMSRSSFFGLAVTTALTQFPGPIWSGLAEPRSKVHRTGGLRTEKPPAKPTKKSTP